MRICTLILAVALIPVATQAQTWTNIATDPSGDTGGLDATSIDYWYDAMNDEVSFRITTTNLASYSTGPAADFSFQLPNGLDSQDPAGAHWTTPGTPVHKIGYVYADIGGSAPSNYTFTAWGQYIEIASTNVQLCTNCISVLADVPNNHLIYTMARQDIITDTEMGGNSATIVLVANVGHDVGWDDNITGNGTFSINLTTGVEEQASEARTTLGPNPTNDRVTVFLNGDRAPVRMVLLDMNGRQAASFATPPVSNGSITCDLSAQAPGTYVMQLSYADGTLERHRLVRQ